jgi:acetyl esterase/lipase
VSRYVSRTGVPMLSLQYRLAPEHPHRYLSKTPMPG